MFHDYKSFVFENLPPDNYAVQPVVENMQQ